MSDVYTLDDYAAELLTAANVALALTDAGSITRAFVSPSLPVLDCCPQLTVDVRSLAYEITVPTTPLPQVGHRVTTAGIILATLVITAVRCAPVMDETKLPPVGEMEAAARQTNEDVWAIWNTLSTMKRDGTLFGGRCPALYLDPPVPLAQQGGCVGWVFTVRAAIDGFVPVLPS